jgi:hypothetical protein
MALGKLNAVQSVPLLIKMLNNDRNVIEIQYAAARALGSIATDEALEALCTANNSHPVKLVQVVAREMMWLNGESPVKEEDGVKTVVLRQMSVPSGDPKEIVFIKGPHDTGHQFQISKDLTGYSTTDSGPVYRMGSNIFKIKTSDPEHSLEQLTFFKESFVADLEVSYGGNKLLFSHRNQGKDPWWHVFEMNADGSDIRQLTFGPYHDVHPNYMPDGRIVFSSSRLGARDEYHGYPSCGLSVMNNDGTDIHVIGFNLGLDAEPVVAENGKIIFSRLEVFYSRVKTEWNLISVLPDGTTPITIYGPERRKFWIDIPGAEAISPPRHRVLRISQPQSWGNNQYIINSFKGPMLIGPGSYKEKILRPDNSWAVTTPYKISNEKLLVAAGKRGTITKDGKTIPDIMGAVNHGLYYMDVETGELALIYDDPKTADFEARPLQPHKIPPTGRTERLYRVPPETRHISCNASQFSLCHSSAGC